MTFEVRPKANKGLVAVRILCVAMIAGITWFINWDIMREYMKSSGSLPFFVGFIAVFLLMFFYSFYVAVRPRIEVRGRDIAIYPRWRPCKRITLSEITARKEKGDTSCEETDAAVAGALLGGGLLTYALTQRRDSALQVPRAYAYTYYSGDAKLITISTARMENAERFDQMVADYLEGRLPAAETSPGTAAEEAKPDKKARTPLVLIGVVGAVCVLGIGAMGLLHTQDRQEQQNTGPAAYTYEDITFEIDPEWAEVEGYPGSFRDNSTRVIYQINGVSELGPYTPEEFYFALVDFYKQGHSGVISRPMEESAGPDGARRYMADMKMEQDGVYLFITIVVFPDQDTVVTFGAQAGVNSAALYEEEIIQRVKDMAASAVCGQEHGAGGTMPEGDVLAGTAWIARDDGSYWMFHEDQSFHWYQTKGVTDDNYFAGTYEFHIGQDAVDYVTHELSRYGVTEEEIMGVIAMREDYTLENFVCVSVMTQSFLLNGEEQLTEDRPGAYFGCLLSNGTYLDIVNMLTGTNYHFTKEQ